ncbi:MAG: Xaa-Pro dipeptidase [Candidatus Wenzhouxiangella sp. M2_3B_020]
MADNPEIPNRDALYGAHVRALTDRTEALLARSGHDRLLLHSGRPRARFQDDYVPPFRAHPHFVAWLPLPGNPDCLLELRPGRRPRLWLVVPDDFWHAPPAPPESWWAGFFEIETVADAEQWQHVLETPMATALIGDPDDFTTLNEHADLNPPELIAGLDELRTVKTDWQIACIAAANRIAVAGHRAAEDAFRAGSSELGIHLAYLRAAGHDPDRLPYGSIVGLNEHAAVLHYQYRDAEAPEESRSFLIDAGADCHGYAADVTRTYAAEDGEFAELIGEVEIMQRRLASRMQAGRSYVDLHREAHRGIGEILRGAGICDMSLDALLEAGVTSTFLPHGLGHFIGVQVHDVAGRVAPDGEPLPPPAAHPSLRLTRELEAGNVLTVEPGLYFIPSLLDELRGSPLSSHIDWKMVERLRPYGGIRIEDDVVVRTDEPDNLTRQAWAEATA